MSCCAVRWQDQAVDGGNGHNTRQWTRPPWHGWEIALMLVGFVVFWPIGLAILFWILWKKRHGDAMAPAWLER